MENMIDFPCSPAWASYYAEQGLTQDYPREYYDMKDLMAINDKVARLERLVNILEQNKMSGPATKQEVYELRHLVNKLIARVNEKAKEYGRY